MQHELDPQLTAMGRHCAICDAPLPRHPSAGGHDVCHQSACRHRWRIERHRVATRCEICGKPLPAHHGETVCGRAECRRRRDHRRVQERQARKARQRDRADRCRDSVARQHGLQPDEVMLVIVPRNQDPLANLPDRKKRRFRDHLLRAVSEAAARLYGHGRGEPAEPVDPPPAFAAPEESGPEDPAEVAVLGNACATCRGVCCRLGGDHAFIRPETILRYMDAHPGVRPRDVYAAYMSRLGPRTSRNGCVYQGPRGCTLTRAMRSDVCNRFLCEDLIELQRQFRSTGLQRLVAVGFTDGEEPAAATYTDDSSGEREDLIP